MSFEKFINSTAFFYITYPDFQDVANAGGIDWYKMPDELESVKFVRKYLELRSTQPQQAVIHNMSGELAYLDNCDIDLGMVPMEPTAFGYELKNHSRTYTFKKLGEELAKNPEKGERLLAEFSPTLASPVQSATVDDLLPVELSMHLALVEQGEAVVEVPGFEMLSNMIGGFNPGNLIMLTGQTGFGKCLGEGTPVLMYDGSIRQVEEIIVGDLLMGPDSKPRQVLGLGRGRSEMYRINPVKGESFVCNGPHILSLHESGTKDSYREMTVEELLKLSKSAQSRMKLWRTGVDFGNNPTLPVEPYFVGLWLGDGSYNRPDVTTAEPEVEQYVRQFATASGLVTRAYQGKGCKTLNLTTGDRGGYMKNRNWLKVALTSFYIDGQKRIPKEYLTASREQRLDLLAGIVDTDGFTCQTCIEIATKYSGFADDITFLARSLGLYVSRASKIVMGAEYQRLVLSGHTDMIPCRVERRKPTPRKQKKDVLRSGFTVESIGVDDYYGFQIDGDGLFLLGDFTVTHNTQLGLQLAMRMALKHTVGYINMEMVYRDIAKRLIVIGTETSYDDYRAGRVSRDDVDHFCSLLRSRFHITDGRSLSLSSIEAWARLQSKRGMKLLMVDYDQKIDLTVDKNTPEWKAVQKAIIRLEDLAKELGFCCVIFAQINREGDISSSHRATFSAHTVLSFEDHPEVGPVIIAKKNRHGTPNMGVRVKYDKNTSVIKELETLIVKPEESQQKFERKIKPRAPTYPRSVG